MSLQDQNDQLREAELATGRFSPPSGEHLTLDRVPQKFITGGAFLLNKTDTPCLHEYYYLCSALPESESEFENRYSTLYIEEYLDSFQVGTYNVG